VNADGVIVAVTTLLQEPDQDFFVKGFSALVASWNKGLHRGGD
jgi:hypothetical protein